MDSLVYSFLFPMMIVIPVFLGAALLRVAKHRDRKRVNPLTKSLRRPPGNRLSRQLTNAYFDLAMWPSMAIFGVAFPLVIHLSQSYLLGRPETVSRYVISALSAVILLSVFLRKLMQVRTTIRDTKLAYECELAVGQELDQLMRDGFQVFHDVPDRNFNIDHVVVGPTGVYAIETKGRSKRIGTAGADKADYHVQYGNGALRFPGWTESAPIDQARRNAKTVSKWLTKATGFRVKAKPVVVLPGWYVDYLGSEEVSVIAAGMIPTHFAREVHQQLSPKQMQQIAYQVEQRVRDLDPGDVLRPIE